MRRTSSSGRVSIAWCNAVPGPRLPVLAAGCHSDENTTDDRSRMSTALLTDRYELTMLEAALAGGLAEHRAVFEVFCRRLPPGRRFGVVAGQGRLAALLPQVRYGDAELEA